MMKLKFLDWFILQILKATLSHLKFNIIYKILNCDYYDWLEGTASGINAYHGQYMTQYSWAEITNASLN